MDDDDDDDVVDDDEDNQLEEGGWDRRSRIDGGDEDGDGTIGCRAARVTANRGRPVDGHHTVVAAIPNNVRAAVC